MNSRRRRRATKSWRRVVWSSITIVAVLAVGTTGIVAAWLAGWHGPLASGKTYLKVEKLARAEAFATPTDPFYVLLVGSDLRPGVGGARADAIHILGVNPALKAGAIINIPRDTCVNIPGRGTRKVNEAHSNGGLPLQAVRRPRQRMPPLPQSRPAPAPAVPAWPLRPRLRPMRRRSRWRPVW